MFAARGNAAAEVVDDERGVSKVKVTDAVADDERVVSDLKVDDLGVGGNGVASES